MKNPFILEEKKNPFILEEKPEVKMVQPSPIVPFSAEDFRTKTTTPMTGEIKGYARLPFGIEEKEIPGGPLPALALNVAGRLLEVGHKVVTFTVANYKSVQSELKGEKPTPLKLPLGVDARRFDFNEATVKDVGSAMIDDFIRLEKERPGKTNTNAALAVLMNPVAQILDALTAGSVLKTGASIGLRATGYNPQLNTALGRLKLKPNQVTEVNVKKAFIREAKDLIQQSQSGKIKNAQKQWDLLGQFTATVMKRLTGQGVPQFNKLGQIIQDTSKALLSDIGTIRSISVGLSIKEVGLPAIRKEAQSLVREVASRGGDIAMAKNLFNEIIKTTSISSAQQLLSQIKEIKSAEEFMSAKELSQTLRGTKGMTTQEIMAKYPDIKLKKDVPIKDIHGNKVIIDKGEKLTPYELKGNKILLQDGETYIVSKNQYQNIKGQSVVGEAKEFAPELKGLEETIRRGSTRVRGWDGSETGATYKNTKFSQYQLPGGTEYEEVLIKAPENIPTGGFKVFNTKTNSFNILDKDGNILKPNVPATFKSSHWDEDNVLAHTRRYMYRDKDIVINGKKEKVDILFGDERQSDWARELRSKGSGIPNHPLLKIWHKLDIQSDLIQAVKKNADYYAWANPEQHLARWGTDAYSWKKKPGGTYEIKYTDQLGGRAGGIDIENEARVRGLLNEGKIVNAKSVDDLRGAFKDRADKVWAKIQSSNEGFSMPRKEFYQNLGRDTKNIVEDLTGAKVEILDMGLPIEKVKETLRIGTDAFKPLLAKDLKIGQEFNKGLRDSQYTITDILGDGKFKAVPKKIWEERLHTHSIAFNSHKETFDISIKTTTQQGIKLTPEIKAKIRGEAPNIQTSGEMFNKTPKEIKPVEAEQQRALVPIRGETFILPPMTPKKSWPAKTRMQQELKTAKLEREKAKILGPIKTAKEILDRRRAKIRAIQEHFNLTDTDLKKVNKRDIRLMSNFEFKNFLDAIRIQADKFAIKRQAMNELIQQIQDKELNVENLRKAMKLPTMKNMTVEHIRKLDEALKPFQKGDEFLSVRKLEVVDRTELKGIKTWREARERLAKKLNVSVEKLQNIEVSEFDRFRYDTALAERNDFYKMMVEEPAKRMLVSEAEYLHIEKNLLALAKKLPKKGIIGRLIPQQKNIRKFMETPINKRGDIEMTSAEIGVVNFMTKHFDDARNYLVQMEAMKLGKDNYFTHIRRGILEAVKEDGIIKAVKEVFSVYKLEEQVFNILDQQTGEILAMDKFFKFAMHRTGELVPTENTIRAFLAYMRTFKKKQALDEIVPLIDIYAHSLTPRGTTKKGVLLHSNLIRFTKEWLNTQKGRHITLVAKQNGKIDGVLRSIKMFTSLRDLALNIPVSVATEIGEQVTTYQLLGKKKYLLGKIRQNTKQGKVIIEKYRNLVGKNPWAELVEPAKEIGDRLMEGIFILFRDASTRANKTFLLGSLSKQELQSGTIDSARLASLRTELGRYRQVKGMTSIIGATPEGKAYTQYKKWAIPILRTTVKNLENITFRLGSKTVTTEAKKKSLLELYRLAEVTVFAMLVFSRVRDEKDTSFVGQLRNKAYREATTLIQALSFKMFLSLGRTASFIEKLGENLTLLLLLEKDKTKPGLKGLKRQFTPVAVKPFIPTKKTTGEQQNPFLPQIRTTTNPFLR